MKKNVLKILGGLLGLAALAGALWWMFFALKPYDLTPAEFEARYAHRLPGARPVGLRIDRAEPVLIGATQGYAAMLRFESFDGAVARGRIVFPEDPAAAAAAGRRWPLLLALHGMGRTQWRWWLPEYKGRPTMESTHLLAERALQQGHALVALDARDHGDRKNETQPLISWKLMARLHLLGQREPYERLIADSVKDYRVLLDALASQPQLDLQRIGAAGYSMGAQMALLLAGADARVRAVAAVVPPDVDDKVAAVSPTRAARRLGDRTVWLLTADDDEHASVAANDALFAALPGTDKQHLRFEGGHLLPARYVERLRPWLAARGGASGPPAAGP
jgi:dienelactone hydrolase